MSGSFYLESFASYPEKESVFAVFPSTLSPFRRAEIGSTSPIEQYRIHRDGAQTYTVFEYVVSGRGEVVLDGQKYSVKAGDLFILPAGEPHLFRSDPTDPFAKLWIKYESEYMLPMLNSYGVRSGVFKAEGARSYFERLLRLPETNLTESEAIFMISECVNKLVYLAASSKSVNAGGDEMRIREALNTSVYQKIDLDDIAERLHMSKSNIIRKYKKRYGVTPYEYLLGLKIENAKIMLKSTNMTVREIAERLCISDEHYFSSLFYRRVGMRPLVYRNTEQDL